MFIIETERLGLRNMTVEDADSLLSIFSDPVAMKYYPSTIDRAGTLEWIKRTEANYRRYGCGFWVVERREDGQFIGQCGLIPQQTDAGMDMEVAYLLAREFWGQGYATEAAMACRDWGFAHLGVPRLVSVISVHNTPSIKVAERNGMTRSSEIVKPSGVLHRVYAISREDWLRGMN